MTGTTGTRVADFIVVGGGILGCSAALHLARRGGSVIVLEKDRVARHASGVNAGGVRRLGRDYPEVPIAQAAWSYWQDMPALVNDDCGFRATRHLKVARSENDLKAARRRVADLKALGFSHEEVIDRDTLREFLPAAAAHCSGALHVAGDGAALPFRTTQVFKRRAQKLGARFFENTPVSDLRHSAGTWRAQTPGRAFEAPTVVNAAGAWAGRLAEIVGDRVPLAAHAPMLVITNRLPAFVLPVVGAFGEPLSFKQFDNGTVLIGGGVRGEAYPESNRTVLDMPALTQMLGTALDIFSIMQKAHIVRAWAGIEAYTPDDLPVIGKGGNEGIVHAFGFSAHGFQLAPAVGAIAADLATGSEPTLPIEAFKVSRFK